MFYVYIIRSLKNKRHYIGYTSNLNQRLDEHNRGESKSVKNRAPFELVYKEAFDDRISAIKRERQIKRYKGGDAFKQLITKYAFDPIV